MQARSSGGERHPDAVDVQGSNPCVPTIIKNHPAFPNDRRVGVCWTSNKVLSGRLVLVRASSLSVDALS